MMNSKLFFKKIRELNTGKEYRELEKIITFKSNNKKIISINNICQHYKNKKGVTEIFNDISFDIYEGDCLALIGANGSGKTTIVEIISGFKKPTSGKVDILIDNVDKNKLIGVQFQDLTFPKSLTTYDIIKFVLKLDNLDMNDEIFEMLQAFQIDSIINRKVSKLSGGQQQRLNVLLSLINKPKILFLDEFTTGLDIAVKNNIKNFIAKYCKENNITIVIISHDIDIISQMANRVVLIANKEKMIDMSMEDINKKFKSFSNLVNKYIY